MTLDHDVPVRRSKPQSTPNRVAFIIGLHMKPAQTDLRTGDPLSQVSYRAESSLTKELVVRKVAATNVPASAIESALRPARGPDPLSRRSRRAECQGERVPG